MGNAGRGFKSGVEPEWLSMHSVSLNSPLPIDGWLPHEQKLGLTLSSVAFVRTSFARRT